jgi:hypothetical protein
LELHRKLSGSDRDEVLITDIFGGEIDAAKLEARARGSDRDEVLITDIFGGEIDAAKLEARASAQKALEPLP